MHKTQTMEISPVTRVNQLQKHFTTPCPLMVVSKSQLISLNTCSQLINGFYMCVHFYLLDSTSGSPLATDAPCELPAESKSQNLPSNLTSIYGKPSLSSRRTENDCKIVLYILVANEHKSEKSVLKGLYAELQRYCASRGFELLLCDLHEESENFLDPTGWVNEPIEARGGHHLAAECLSEIASKFVGILFYYSRNKINLI